MNKNQEEQKQPTFYLYKNPWFILVCILAVLCMVAYTWLLA
ncbi:hypothetical protein [Fructobacillus durionis]|uniref:Uncharacterized protein n=1 Tax=Fructobacillus durionis TaxID=283737 RepID=A0A1I1DTP9_9LACO|nr:hypothetical protein [Fructobacillus durionis]SFB77786.1 hypothetical protein SAMN05660453_0104 [Fructobacillus durionis]